MSYIRTSRFTERMTRRLNAAGINLWVGQSSGDTCGKYLLFRVGGPCVAGCGWTQAEAEQIVDDRIASREESVSHEDATGFPQHCSRD